MLPSVQYDLFLCREMFGNGDTFYGFLTNENAIQAFRLRNTQFIGGFFAVLNPSLTGYYKEVPILEVTMPLVPYEWTKLSSLKMNVYKPEETSVKKVICSKMLIFENVICLHWENIIIKSLISCLCVCSASLIFVNFIYDVNRPRLLSMTSKYRTEQNCFTCI
jgi:hypothetical protein